MTLCCVQWKRDHPGIHTWYPQNFVGLAKQSKTFLPVQFPWLNFRDNCTWMTDTLDWDTDTGKQWYSLPAY